MSAPWPKVKLGDVVTHRKEFIAIDDFRTYKRPRVRLHVQGIVLRDEVPGALIKTKKQQVCRTGEFLVAEIDAKVGGFGIVPRDLDDAIVSSHYFLFVSDQNRLDQGFLGWFIKTLAFREQVAAQGSTNYAAIRPGDVLEYEMPLPPLEEQQRIVARIEALVARISEARFLRNEAIEEAAAFIVSLHLSISCGRAKRLGDLLRLDEDQVPIEPDNEYRQVGVKGFGAGLFPKPAVRGTATTYRSFNRLYQGALVLSQVKGWEGAVAVCRPELVGYFVSPEYRTFRCFEGQAVPEYLAVLVQTKWFWGQLKNVTRGVGARRERTRPEQFLTLELPMPDVDKQELAVQIFKKLEPLKDLHSQTVAELDALIPSILSRAFGGDTTLCRETP